MTLAKVDNVVEMSVMPLNQLRHFYFVKYEKQIFFFSITVIIVIFSNTKADITLPVKLFKDFLTMHEKLIFPNYINESRCVKTFTISDW